MTKGHKTPPQHTSQAVSWSLQHAKYTGSVVRWPDCNMTAEQSAINLSYTSLDMVNIAFNSCRAMPVLQKLEKMG